MSGCRGMHCGGCGHHGGGGRSGAAVAALVFLVIVGALGDPSTRHALGEVVGVLVLAAISAVALAVVVGLAAVAIRVRRARAARALCMVVIPPAARRAVDADGRPVYYLEHDGSRVRVLPPADVPTHSRGYMPARVVTSRPGRRRGRGRSGRWS